MFNAIENYNQTELKIWMDFIERVITEESEVARALLIISMYFIFFASIIGNGITCLVIYYDRSMHTATNFYLFNLAISDFIVSFAIFLEVNELTLPSTKPPHFNLGRMACKTHFIVVAALWNNSILILTALAIERYVAICYPLLLKTKSVWRRVTKIIVVIWIIAIMETIPELWTSDLLTTSKYSLCTMVPTPYAKTTNGVMAVLTFILPLSIMTFVYSMIAWELRTSQKCRPHDNVFNQRNNRRKVNKLIALTLGFLISWLPFFSLRMSLFIYDITHIVNMEKWWRIGFNLTLFNSWFSTVLNPLLFSLMSTKFRRSLRLFWKKKIKRESEVIRPCNRSAKLCATSDDI
ncbi:pyrokinin-1 receptor isoform X2 [Manduca sexta]|uniref:pyrokinin-1 receptor isoform X2 n=1 Tax=Manduca sexta TaxID=7130 RepID=UPI00188E2373|nr:pyrokinin-1 receptor isoform X2 [Manduca sexta]